MSDWQDISKINDFKEYYEFNDYVVLVDDEDGCTYTDVAFGIALIPPKTLRFFCVPNDELITP